MRERDRDDHRDAEHQQPQFERRQPAPGVREIGDRHGTTRPCRIALASLIVPAPIGSGCGETIRYITARDEPCSRLHAEPEVPSYCLGIDGEFALGCRRFTRATLIHYARRAMPLPALAAVGGGRGARFAHAHSRRLILPVGTAPRLTSASCRAAGEWRCGGGGRAPPR